MALDDSHRTSFLTKETVLDYENFHVYTWANGGIGHYTFKDGPVPPPGKMRYYHPADINSRGKVVGGLSISTMDDPMHDRVFFVESGSSPVKFPSPDDKDWYHSSSTLTRVSPSGNMVGSGTYNKKKSDGTYEIVTIPYFNTWQKDRVGGFTYLGMDSLGRVIGFPHWTGLEPKAAIWDSKALSFFPEGSYPVDLNRHSWSLGYTPADSAVFETPTAAFPLASTYIPLSLRDLVRPTAPIFVNDKYEVLFLGDAILGDGTGESRYGYGWLNSKAGGTNVAWVHFGGATDFSAKAENEVGTLGGVSQGKAAIAIPVEFQPVDPTDLTRGFDYPMADDPPAHFVANLPPEAKIKDQDAPKWWTSVAQSNVLLPNLHINNTVKVVFQSEAAAKLCELHVPNETALTVDNAHQPLKRETPIVIRGKPNANGDIVVGEVQVRTKDTTHQVLQTLHVMVLPERKVSLQVMFVDDILSEPSNFDPAHAEYLDINEITKYLSKVYRPMCITFVPSSNSGYLPLKDWDSNSSGKLETVEELTMVNNLHINPTVTMNLMIFRELAHPNNLKGFVSTDWPSTAWIGVVNAVNVLDFHQTCAHELGHVLDLSARKSRHPIMNAVQPHDGPVFPRRYGVLPIMMFNSHPACSWFRNEEWKPANENAINYVIP